MAVFITVFFICGFELGVIFPPRPEKDSTVVIEKGMAAGDGAALLKKAHIIRSEFAFTIAARIARVESRFVPGRFEFSEPISLVRVVQKLLEKQEVTVVIPEGSTRAQIADILEAADVTGRAEFLDATARSEGYLFPDTYRFYQHIGADDAANRMRDTFESKIALLETARAKSGRTVADMIMMASILEEESKTIADRRIIAGILWKRLATGMSLQVDASPETYKHAGFPQEPLSSPGIEAMQTALEPAESPYFYYLYDKEGVVHFARTFEEHKLNKARYLR